MPIKDALATVLNRNAFYRDGYRLLLRISIVQGIVILLLIGGLVSLVLSMDTKRVYFATTSDGRIIEVVPVSEEYLSPAQVISWAARSTQKVMRFDFHNYRQHLQEVSTFFTPSGWESFTKALRDARILETVEARKLYISMVIGGAPEIQKKMVRDGVYTWYLSMPIEIKFEGPEAPGSIAATLILQIVRVSTLQNPDGISIEQWIAKQR